MLKKEQEEAEMAIKYYFAVRRKVIGKSHKVSQVVAQ